MQPLTDVYLYGASGHCKVVIEILEEQEKKVKAIFDDNDSIKELLGYPVYAAAEIEKTNKKDPFILSIGNNAIRKRIVENIDVQYGTAIHKYSNLSSRISLGEGTVVMAGVVVNSTVSIGKHVILNTNCSVDHDCIISDYVHLSPNVALAGDVFVGEGTHIGIGATVIQGIRIGKWATIGAGAVIIRDVPDYAVVVGNPGRIIKFNKDLI